MRDLVYYMADCDCIKELIYINYAYNIYIYIFCSIQGGNIEYNFCFKSKKVEWYRGIE